MSELSILFRAGQDRYAVRAADVFKVVEPWIINRLPALPAALMGISQHRGRIVTVVDLAEMFSPGAREDGASSVSEAAAGAEARVIILARRGRHLAFLVDAVEAIQPVRRPETGELSALSQHQGLAVNVLDTAKLIDRVEALIADG